MPGAHLARESFFVFSPSNGHRIKSHFVGELNPQVTQPSNSLHRHQIAGPSARISERVKNRNPRAHEWSRFFGRQAFRNGSQPFRWHNHEFLIASIKMPACNLGILAKHKVAAPAGIALETMASVPAHTHALSLFPKGLTRADGINQPSNFVAGNARIRNGPNAFLDDDVRMTNPAGFHLDAHLSRSRFGNFPIHNLPGTARLADLYRFHFFDGDLAWHKTLPLLYVGERQGFLCDL